MTNIREATLKNPVMIDYLLLRHNYGCEDFKGTCCFNLCDNSHLVEKTVRGLKDSASKFSERQGTDFLWLTSLLPNLNWLKQLFLINFLIMLILVLSCCTIQCLPICTDLCRHLGMMTKLENNPFIKKIEKKESEERYLWYT